MHIFLTLVSFTLFSGSVVAELDHNKFSFFPEQTAEDSFSEYLFSLDHTAQKITTGDRYRTKRLIVGEDLIFSSDDESLVLKGKIFDIDPDAGFLEALEWLSGEKNIDELLQPASDSVVKALIAQTWNETTTDKNGEFEITISKSDLNNNNISELTYEMNHDDYGVRPSYVYQLDKKRPLAIVDIDKTIYNGGTKAFMFDSPEDIHYIPKSLQVVELLIQKNYQIVYLTQRDKRNSYRNLMWLSREGFPKAPVIHSEMLDSKSPDYQGDYSKNKDIAAETYKTKALKQLIDKGYKVLVGLGDKPSDAKAYKNAEIPYSFIFEYKEGHEMYEQVKALENFKEISDFNPLSSNTVLIKDWNDVLEIEHFLPTY